MEEDDAYLEDLDGDELEGILSNQLSSASTPVSTSTPIQSPTCLRQTPSSQNSAEPSEASGQQSSGTCMFFQ